MNKQLIGNFLRTLREEKKLTQIQLSNKLGGCYSDALISKWERGVSVPYIEDLKVLAKYFNVTVDEILNGARYEEVDLKKKYFIYNNDWLMQYNDDDLYNIREEQELLIETRFKELLRKMVDVGLTSSEDKEFDFIVNHFYLIYIPAIEAGQGFDGEYCQVEDLSFYEINSFSDIKFEIYKQAALMHNSTVEEKFWEANKKFISNIRQNIWRDINNCIDDAEDDVRNRILKIEDCEKDILLAALQQVNIIHTLAGVGTRGEELYEKKYGRKYDEEQLTKRAIKLLIECGAKLNKMLLGYWRVYTQEYNIINELVAIHKRYKAPLLVPVCEDGHYHYFTVDNTAKNRVKLDIKYENETFDESDYEELEKKLYAGEKILLKPSTSWVCGSSEWDAFIYARKQLLNMSLEAYNKSRDDQMTEELLANLDNMSLVEIRKKYFPAEYRGEYIDDKRTKSPEELKKKYYIKEAINE